MPVDRSILLQGAGWRTKRGGEYCPYGLRWPGGSTAGEQANEYLYNGKELAEELGLNWYHYGARYYATALSRWAEMDPADQFHSPYTYVGNDPVNLVDPDGRQANSAHIMQGVRNEGRLGLNKEEFGSNTLGDVYADKWYDLAISVGSGTRYLDSKTEKEYFNHYVYGQGETKDLSSEDISDIQNEVESMKSEGVDVVREKSKLEGGRQSVRYDLGASSEYGGALGSITIEYDKSGEVQQLYDTYDFNPQEWGQRSYEAEVITRFINYTAPSKAQQYKIRYDE